jgi:threonine/homoserine/homoserine lactone efflux protein
MENVWLNISSVLLVFTLAIVSPGPNFILVVNRSLTSSRRNGVYTAFGVATGSGVFAFAGLVGLLPLVKSLPYFMGFMRFAGGGYLVWVGFDMLRTSRVRFESSEDGDRETSSPYIPYRHGLITNLTNPKAWAFYLSLFTLVMETSFPVWSKVLLNASMFLISLAWYVSVVCLVSSNVFQPIFLNYKALFQGVLGLLVIVAGVKVLWG